VGGRERRKVQETEGEKAIHGKQEVGGVGGGRSGERRYSRGINKAVQSWLEEQRDGDSKVEPQEPESELGGGKAVTRECAQSLKYAQLLETAPAGLQTRRGTAVTITASTLKR
jgi:hypothetical protein